MVQILGYIHKHSDVLFDYDENGLLAPERGGGRKQSEPDDFADGLACFTGYGSVQLTSRTTHDEMLGALGCDTLWDDETQRQFEDEPSDDDDDSLKAEGDTHFSLTEFYDGEGYDPDDFEGCEVFEEFDEPISYSDLSPAMDYR